MQRAQTTSPVPTVPKARGRDVTGAADAVLRLAARGAPALLGALIILFVWQMLVDALRVSPVILPSPVKIGEAIGRALPLLLRNSIPTASEAAIGFGISIVTGIALAVLLASSKLIRNALYPNVLFFQLIPKIALAPLFIVWFGIGSPSRLAFIIFISFFPIVLNTMQGLLSTPPELLRLCRACSARKSDVFLHVRLPYAVPMIFSGLKIAVAFAIIGVVVGEFISAQAGLGYLILFASSQADTALALAAITFLCVLGLALYGVVVGAETLVLSRLGEKKIG